MPGAPSLALTILIVESMAVYCRNWHVLVQSLGGGGGDGGGGSYKAVRGPQSIQSVPLSQPSLVLPSPPSWQNPSPTASLPQVFSHINRGGGGVGDGGGGKGGGEGGGGDGGGTVVATAAGETAW